MKVLTTPENRFDGLHGWNFAPNRLQIHDADGTPLSVHYVDEGPRTADPVLLLHGEPSWAYLYRNIIPALAAAGHRAVAPDLIGFGRSDKPADRSDYTYERHVAWMSAWLTGLDLKEITLFCQDWGGLIGLRLVAAFPERFKAVAIANTGLPTGSGFSEAFNAWLAFSQNAPVLPISMIVNGGCARDLTAAELAAYDAPFPDESFKEGARQFPALVPITPEHRSVAENKAAWTALERFEKPFVTAFSDGDPITRGGAEPFLTRVPGALGQSHVTLKGGHFIQEDSPEAIARLLDALARGSSPAPAQH